MSTISIETKASESHQAAVLNSIVARNLNGDEQFVGYSDHYVYFNNMVDISIGRKTFGIATSSDNGVCDGIETEFQESMFKLKKTILKMFGEKKAPANLGYNKHKTRELDAFFEREDTPATAFFKQVIEKIEAVSAKFAKEQFEGAHPKKSEFRFMGHNDVCYGRGDSKAHAADDAMATLGVLLFSQEDADENGYFVEVVQRCIKGEWKDVSIAGC